MFVSAYVTQSGMAVLLERFKESSISAMISGFVAVLVGFTSSIALVFQATQALGATPEQTASWVWAISAGIIAPTVILAWRYRQPIMITWSVPGVAVVGAAAKAGHLTLPQALGAFVLSSVLIIIAGFSGGFERIMKRLPLPLAAALLAGVLARFSLDAFMATPENPVLLITMACIFVLGRSFMPRAAVPLVLLGGVLIAALQGLFRSRHIPIDLTLPVWTTPEFSPAALIGTGIPLFIVTMASQNLPGVSALRLAGYEPPVSKIIGWSGVTNLALAPFGAFGINLAAVTAAFCVTPEAHPDPTRRYWAPIWAAVFYGLLGALGATVAALFAAFPRELILAIAGLALLPTIANALAGSLTDERYREASILTFFVALSGVTLAGIGAAFWAVIAGLVVLGLRLMQKNTRENSAVR